MGLSPAAEGRKDGRKDGEARLSWRGARSPDRCDLQEGGGGAGLQQPIIGPVFKRGGARGGRWVSWYVTRLPQQLHSLRNQLRRSGGRHNG